MTEMTAKDLVKQYTCNGIVDILTKAVEQKATDIVQYQVQDMCSSWFGEEKLLNIGGPDSTVKTLEEAYAGNLDTELASTIKVPVGHWHLGAGTEVDDFIAAVTQACIYAYGKLGECSGNELKLDNYQAIPVVLEERELADTKPCKPLELFDRCCTAAYERAARNAEMAARYVGNRTFAGGRGA